MNWFCIPMACLLSTLVAVSSAPTLAAVPGDKAWDSRFHPGLGEVRIFQELSDGSVVAAGNVIAPDQGELRPTPGVIRWTPEAGWRRFGAPLGGAPSSRSAMAEFRGELHISGWDLRAAYGEPVRNLLVWRDARWQEVGGGVAIAPEALVVHEDRLIVGGLLSSAGNLSVTNIAAWDGRNWTSIGEGVPFRVRALASFGGELIAAGDASTSPDLGAVLRWDGQEWHPLGGGVRSTAERQIVIALQAVGTNLYAAGQFSRAGDTDADNIARWDGSRWHPLGDGISVSLRSDFLNLRWQVGALVVAGQFELPGIPANGLALWDGRDWLAYPGNPFVKTWKIALAGTNLLVSGWNQNPVVGELAGVALLHDGDFDIPGLGLRNYDFLAGVGATLASGPAGVLMGGQFRPKSASVWENLALWDGRKWLSLNQGLNYPHGSFDVKSVDVAGTAFVAGGSFPFLSTNVVNSVTRWDGTQWLPLGNGIEGAFRAIAWQGDRVVAAGDSYGEPFGVVVWNGRDWGSLGLSPRFRVAALAIAGEHVFAAGMEPGATQSERHAVVAQWDGRTWTELAREPDATVNCLLHDGDRLVVGGRFSRIAGIDASGVAAWNGTSWSGFADGIPTDGVHEIRSLASDGRGRVFAAGRFVHEASGATNVALFVDGAWQALGSGVESFGAKSAAWWNGGLHVGGDFAFAGRKLSVGFGIWHGSAGDFELDAVAPGSVQPGGDFSVDLTVKRVAGDAARPVTLRLPLPAGVVFVSAEGTGTLVDGGVEWRLDPTNLFPARTGCRLRATSVPGWIALRNSVVSTPEQPDFTARPAIVHVTPPGPPPTVRMVSPTTGEITAVGDIAIATLIDAGQREVSSVEFYADERLLASTATPPWTFVWTNPPLAEVWFRVALVDSSGERTYSLPARAKILARPENDLFEDALELSGDGGNVPGSTTNATTEPDEPGSFAGTLNASVWWRWVAPADGVLWASVGSNTNGLTITAFRGESLQSLRHETHLNRYNQAPPCPLAPERPPGIRLVVRQGETCHLRVHEVLANDRTGFQLQYALDPLPSNDAFTNRTALTSGYRGQIVADPFALTAEPGEPDHRGMSASHSAWWSLKPAAHVRLRLATDSPFVRAVVYRGAALSKLTPVEPREGYYFLGEGIEYCVVLDSFDTSTSFRWSYDSIPHAGRFVGIAVDGSGAASLDFELRAFYSLAGLRSLNFDEITVRKT
jgi:hypothetical protein